MFGDSGHSALLRTLPFGSLNRKWPANARPNFARRNFTYPRTSYSIAGEGLSNKTKGDNIKWN